jgi:hypothetical protein
MRSRDAEAFATGAFKVHHPMRLMLSGRLRIMGMSKMGLRLTVSGSTPGLKGTPDRPNRRLRRRGRFRNLANLVHSVASDAAGCTYCQAHLAVTTASHGVLEAKPAVAFYPEKSRMLRPISRS